VIVRLRPLNKKEAAEEATMVVQKLSANSLSLAEQQFTFDAVAGESESQVSMEPVKVGDYLLLNFLLVSVQIGGDSAIFEFCSDNVLMVVQEAVFKMVGLPMVENCLAGFNSSIFAYGQVLHAFNK
jgi:kinesin family protein 15